MIIKSQPVSCLNFLETCPESYLLQAHLVSRFHAFELKALLDRIFLVQQNLTIFIKILTFSSKLDQKFVNSKFSKRKDFIKMISFWVKWKFLDLLEYTFWAKWKFLDLLGKTFWVKWKFHDLLDNAFWRQFYWNIEDNESFLVLLNFNFDKTDNFWFD